ncbi:MAG TPA: hypothetical protein VNN07_19550, partial [Candidatus Tectomicrobia bacterium]|nr:hypothetical protein [Candidatus Tectomicrobia bacterium]
MSVDVRAGSRRPVTDAWGVDDGYEDARGRWRETSAETRRAIVAAMGGDAEGARAAPGARVVVHG